MPGVSWKEVVVRRILRFMFLNSVVHVPPDHRWTNRLKVDAWTLEILLTGCDIDFDKN